VRELLLVIAIFALLAGGALALQTLPWETFAWAGAALVALGLAFSLPTAGRYHWLLWQALSARGVLRPRWYWNPTGQHRLLLPAERDRILPWFYAGAAGWLMTMSGCLALGVAYWLMG
jgi:signal transduction histidine kinase